MIQLRSRDGLCLKLDHEGREAKPAEEGRGKESERAIEDKKGRTRVKGDGQGMIVREEGCGFCRARAAFEESCVRGKKPLCFSVLETRRGMGWR